MSSGRILRPSEKLRTKFYVWVRAIYWLAIFPNVFMGFIPGFGWTYVWIFLAASAVGLFIAHLLIPPYSRSISYELGDQEIVVRKGIVTRVESVVPYRMVTNVSLKRGLLDRRFGLGGLHIHTAGYSQQTDAEARLSGLEDYEAVRRELLAKLRRYRRSTGPTGGAEPAETVVSEGSVTHLLQQIRDELKALRAEGR